MIFDGFHQEMGMMMDWNSYFWLFIVIGLIVLVLITILIINLMNRSTKQEISSLVTHNFTSESTVEEDYIEGKIKFCPGCGERIDVLTEKYCPLCGIQL